MFIFKSERRIYYDFIGSEGAPVVCMLHSLAADSGLWSEQVPALINAGYRVLRVDMRGHGGTDTAKGEYTMDELADEIADVLVALQTGPVHCVGISLGGMVGLGLALDRPELLRSLVMCDALAGSIENSDQIWGPRMRSVRDSGSVASIAEFTIERWLTPAFKARNPLRWRQIEETIAATPSQGYLRCAAAIQDFDYRPRLDELQMPLLVAAGRDDPAIPAGEAERIANKALRGVHHYIEDALHLPNVEQPVQFNKMMLDWLGTA